MANDKVSRESIEAGILQDEKEHAQHLQNSYEIAKQLGYTVPSSGAPLPELNPDGSYANPEDEMPAEDEDPKPVVK